MSLYRLPVLLAVATLVLSFAACTSSVGAHLLTDTGHNHTNCGQGLAGGLQLVVDGCVGLDRIETQASQEVTSFTIDRIHETALKTSRQ